MGLMLTFAPFVFLFMYISKDTMTVKDIVGNYYSEIMCICGPKKVNSTHVPTPLYKCKSSVTEYVKYSCRNL